MKLLFETAKLEMKLNIRNFLNVFFSLIFPLMMLLLFGAMYGNEPNEFNNGFGSVDFSTPGYICMVVAVSGLMTLPLTLSQYREGKVLKRFMATPIKPSDILIAQLIVNAIMTVISTIFLILVGIIVFDLKFHGNVFAILVASLIVILSIFSIGLFIAGVSPNAKTANAISYVIYFPMLFLSGATLPLFFMPDVIKTISKAFPLTYAVQLMQGIWLGGSIFDYVLEIVILLSIFLVLTFISIKSFRWE